MKSIKRKTISTSRLILRPYRPSDYKIWFEAHVHSLPKQTKFDYDLLSPQKATPKAFKKLLALQAHRAKTDYVYVWPVFLKKTGELIGVLDIFIMCRHGLQMANLGYKVFNRHWRQGYAKEFVSAGIKLSFGHLKVNRLEAAISPTNRASIALVKSLGFKKEGLRYKYWYVPRRWEDQLIYSAQREDFGFPRLHIKK